jgi:TorA maturation chaperone TorD
MRPINRPRRRARLFSRFPNSETTDDEDDDEDEDDSRKRRKVMVMEPSDMTARVYRFLSLAYLKPPKIEYLKAVSQWCANLLAHGEDLPDGVVAGLKRMAEALEPEVSPQLVQQLQEEFVRLIRSPAPHTSPPPPYESVYREGALWGEATLRVLSQYEQWGLEPEDAFQGEPPDHVGLELQFMASLCELEAGAAGQSGGETPPSQAQRDFLRQHLCDWFPRFRQRAIAYKPHPFYEGVFLLTEGWVNLHEQHLSACL